MTRTILAALTVICAVAFVACGDGDDDSPSDTSPEGTSASVAAGSTTPPANTSQETVPPTSAAGAVTDAELSGRIVYVVGGEINQDIWMMNADGSNKHAITTSLDQDSFPDFSPDGTQIVFQRNQDIWIMNDDGTDPHVLFTFGFDPEWSPDGTEVVFSPLINDQLDLAAINVETKEVRTIIADLSTLETYGAWSPDGSRIAYFANLPTAGLLTVPAEGAAAGDPLTTEGFNDVYPDWSPDGQQLVFASPFDGHNVITTVNADGSSRRLIGETQWPAMYPAWSPDGCCIAFESVREDGNWDLYVMRADGSGTRRLTDAPNTDGDLGIDWAE